MPLNISSFSSNIGDYGYLKTNLFEMILAPPPLFTGGYLDTNRVGTPITRIMQNMKFRIDAIRVPGLQLGTIDVPRYGVGPTQKYPFTAQFQEIAFSMIVDRNAELLQFFYMWLRAIFEMNSTDTARTGVTNKLANYYTEYKSNYASTAQINIYDQGGSAVESVNFYEIFPTSVRELPLSWAEQNNLLRVAITMAYTEFTFVSTAIDNGRNNAGNIR